MVKIKNRMQETSPLYQMQQRMMREDIRCACGRVASTVDHIVPQSFLTGIGFKELTWEDGDNLQVMCKACNTAKSGRYDFTNPKTLMLLKKYVALLENHYGEHHEGEIRN